MLQLWAEGEPGFGGVFALNHRWKQLAHVDTPRISATNSKPEVLGKLGIEITLTRSRAKSPWGYQHTRSEEERENRSLEYYHPKLLLDAAFEPRTFMITIEKGNFSHNKESGIDRRYLKERWGFRLIFDKSPYPALENWDWTDGGTYRVEKFGHRRIAVGKPLPESAAAEKPMDDDTVIGIGSLIGDLHMGVYDSVRNCVVS